MKKLGVIINPVAGLGGRVGLKGSDGEETLKTALSLGAKPEAPKRAIQALCELKNQSIKIITCKGDMGENECLKAGLVIDRLLEVSNENTSPEDTKRAARLMQEENVDLLLFAGGDGTARDILEAIGSEIPALGIPSGVKIHSAVYGKTPILAGRAAKRYLSGEAMTLKETEVMDIDEKLFREGRVSAKLYGYLMTPFDKESMQGLKSPNPESEEQSLLGIAEQVCEHMEKDVFYVIGPGTTTREIMKRLGLNNTLLGVDIIKNKELIASDVSESELYNMISGSRFKIIITPIGGQGVILGRGNQQISPRVLNLVGKENIIIISTRGKLNEFLNRVLTVDTGDEETNGHLRGYYRVLTSYGEETVLKCI